ncbi:MAG: hypothetical protein SangKO_074040 [Sandaracinaceae bacterium]
MGPPIRATATVSLRIHEPRLSEDGFVLMLIIAQTAGRLRTAPAFVLSFSGQQFESSCTARCFQFDLPAEEAAEIGAWLRLAAIEGTPGELRTQTFQLRLVDAHRLSIERRLSESSPVWSVHPILVDMLLSGDTLRELADVLIAAGQLT